MFWRNRSILAIDIGSTAIRVAETNMRGESELRLLGASPCFDLLDRNGFVRDEYAAQRQLRELLTSLNIDSESRSCAIALPSSAVSIRMIEIEPQSAIEPHEQMRYLAEQYFAHETGSLQLSLKFLKSQINSNGKLPALLVGARRDVLEQRLTMLRANGLRISIVDCNAICNYNALVAGSKDLKGSILVVNIGHSASDASIICDGMLVYHQSLGLAGRDYSAEIARHESISVEQGEKLKLMMSSGSRPLTPGLLRVIQGLNDEVLDEIEGVIANWWESHSKSGAAKPLRASFLTGGGAQSFGLRQAVEEGIGIPASIFNPFNIMKVDVSANELRHLMHHGHNYSVAVGLAMRSKPLKEVG
jgi:type IV pilus assembly protein PilM